MSDTRNRPPQAGAEHALYHVPPIRGTEDLLLSLSADPAERVLARVLGGDLQLTPGMAPPSSDSLVDAETRLRAILIDFRAEARSHRTLRHSLIVHLWNDPQWTRFVPFDVAGWEFARERASICHRLRSMNVRGIFHSRTRTADATETLKRLVQETTQIVQRLLPGLVSEHDSLAWWVLDLYRSMWSSVPYQAAPCVSSGGQEIPLWIYSLQGSHEDVHPLERKLLREALALGHPPSCFYATLPTDFFSACAEKVALLLASLRVPQSLWLPASWYTQNSLGMNGERLRKARRGKNKHVRWHKVGDNYVYEFNSVCEYAPECREQLLQALPRTR